MDRKIRVENLSGVSVNQYLELQHGCPTKNCRPFTILFIKPYQPSTRMAHGPALGILTLISILRETFGDRVKPLFRDMKVYGEKPDRSEEHTSELQSRPHLVCRLLLEKKNENIS